jgi:hypothetical protein
VDRNAYLRPVEVPGFLNISKSQWYNIKKEPESSPLPKPPEPEYLSERVPLYQKETLRAWVAERSEKIKQLKRQQVAAPVAGEPAKTKKADK